MKVVITGGSKGMGKAMAMKFVSEGHQVVLTARTAATLNAAREEVLKSFPLASVTVFAGDMSKPADAEKFAAFSMESGVPDVLINNAGSYEPGNCKDGDSSVLNRMMGVNFYTAYHVTNAFLPAFIKAGKGHIFFSCSIASLRAYANGGCYGVSKYALNGFSQNLRLELMSHQIKVTNIYPGAVMSDSWGDFDNSTGRIMVAEDIAEMVYAATQLSHQACVEEILIRPQLGDL